MTKYYFLIASKDYIDIGVETGYIQQRYSNRIEKLGKGDKIILYASKLIHNSDNVSNRYQYIVAACKTVDDIYIKTSRKNNQFLYTKKVQYLNFKEQSIKPLIPHLDFIKDKLNWGMYLIGGFYEINKHDYNIIMS